MKSKTRRWIGWSAMASVAVLGVGLVLGNGHAAMTKDFQLDKDAFARYILSTVRAARTIYVRTVIRKAKSAGMKVTEDWVKQDHAIMLPAQFVKALGAEIRGFELSLLGTNPLYEANNPKTPKEKEMLKKLASSKQKMLTFQDGTQFKGIAADFAITQGCADCHNQHPRSNKRDWKKGDFMGAIVVRMRG